VHIGRSRTFWWLFGMSGALVLGSTIIIALVATRRVERFEFLQAEKDLRVKAFLVGKQVRDFHPNQVSRLQADANILNSAIDSRITFLDANGTVLADSAADPAVMENHATRPEIIAARQGEDVPFIHRSRTTGDSMLYVARRVEGKASPVTFVRVATSLEHIEASLVGLERSIWAGAVGTSFGAMFLGFFMARGIAVPVQRLSTAAEHIASTQRPCSVLPVAWGEFGDLSRSLNRLGDRMTSQNTEIRESRRQLQTILDGMVEGALAVDREQRVLFTNTQGNLLLKFVRPEVVGGKLTEIVGDSALGEALTGMLNATESRQEQFVLDERGREKLAIHMIRLTGSATGGAVFLLYHMSGVGQTDRLPNFIADLTQEIRTPLSVIKACGETLLNGAVDDTANRDFFMQQINTEADHLHALIVDTLTLFQIESGVKDFYFEAVPLEPVVADRLKCHLARANARNLVLELLTPEQGDKPPSIAGPDFSARTSPVAVWADEEALIQIFDRLVENAVSRTPSGGRIQIRWRAAATQVFLEVRDRGLDISERDLPRIFDPFFRAGWTRTHEWGGAGLGLSIAQQLAHAMEGAMHVESIPGQGATFIVSLRLASST
jgi:two-component system phosphate regulon sensor histidine kinase PhoR